MKTVDLDDDGDADIVGAGGVDIYVLINDGSGQFSVSDSHLSSGLYLNIGDLNQDGILDIVSTNDAGQVFLGNGDGTFRAGFQFDAPTDLRGVPDLADLNSDGFPDLVVNDNIDSLRWRWYRLHLLR